MYVLQVATVTVIIVWYGDRLDGQENHRTGSDSSSLCLQLLFCHAVTVCLHSVDTWTVVDYFGLCLVDFEMIGGTLMSPGLTKEL